MQIDSDAILALISDLTTRNAHLAASLTQAQQRVSELEAQMTTDS